ncbi:MAG: serine hydrolase [Duganella sp.]
MIISPTLRTVLTGGALSALLAASACHAADANAALRAIVDHAVRPLIAEYDLPGVAVAVTVDDMASFFNYGLASREHATPVSENTLFELGSISKTFTATLASYAQVTGKLSLDDHPGKYLPELNGSAIDKANACAADGSTTADYRVPPNPPHVSPASVTPACRRRA